MKILVVDDSPTSLTIVRSYLEKMNHEVITTTAPTECEPLFLREKPDLILLDVMMEKQDGYECALRLRALQSSDEEWVPIIFISALVDDESIAKCIDAGGDDYLTKPFSEMRLMAKIKAMQRIAEMRARLSRLTTQLERANYQLSQISMTDELTGIANRRAFDARYATEWKHALRDNSQTNELSLIMIDIDHFKEYNDKYGHQAGDDCLREVASTLDSLLPRGTDEIFRIGGEEFVVILPMTERDNAVLVAERLLKGIREIKNSNCEPITISLGVSSENVTLDSEPEEFLGRVDKALYAAKTAGRNRIVSL